MAKNDVLKIIIEMCEKYQNLKNTIIDPKEFEELHHIFSAALLTIMSVAIGAIEQERKKNELQANNQKISRRQRL
jgi:hypothetical protein